MGGSVKVDADELFALDGKPFTRTFEFEVDDQVFLLHEISAATLWEHEDSARLLRERITKESKPEEDAASTAALNELAVRILVTFLRGETHEVTSDDARALKQNLSSDQIDKLYTAGMNYTGATDSSRDEISKN